MMIKNPIRFGVIRSPSSTDVGRNKHQINIPFFRLVPEGQGSLAQGVQQTFGRFVGFIPAAPLFGGLIDKSCQLWHVQPCNKETTSCLEYDNEKFK